MMREVKLNPGDKITVVGDIHEHPEQFERLLELVKPSPQHRLVSTGDIYDRGYGKKYAEQIIDKFQELDATNSGKLVPGNHEFKHLNRGERSKQLDWVKTLPFVLSFAFANGTRILVMHAGVTPNTTQTDLENNHSDLIYVRNVDEWGKIIPLIKDIDENGKKIYRLARPGKSWHEVYDGRFGYIVAGHEPQKDGIPKFYPYSCNLDTACYHTGVLTAATFDENGRVGIFQVNGPTYNKQA